MFWLNKAHAASFAPEAGTTVAEHWDSLYSFLVYASLISSILVIGGLIYFAVKYRRRSENDKTAYISHNGTLEFIWSFIPFVIFMVVFGWGWVLYSEMRTIPKDSLEVHVFGQKWSWNFQYKSGKQSIGEFYVPVNTPVKLIMTSKDVIHSFFIPGFRIKQDVVPGMYTALWFEANKQGTFQVFCTEYCGKDHSNMLAKVHVLSKEKYEEWLQNNPYKGMTPIQVGEKNFKQRCTACHDVTGIKRLVGPALKGLFGKERKFVGGSTTVADENYFRESLMYPNKKVVDTFSPVMPPFKGQLSEEELLGLIEFVKSL